MFHVNLIITMMCPLKKNYLRKIFASAHHTSKSTATGTVELSFDTQLSFTPLYYLTKIMRSPLYMICISYAKVHFKAVKDDPEYDTAVL